MVFVTDDYFASDIFNGELPGRALVGQALRQGHLPVWTSNLCSGLPLAGVPLDPIGIGPFVLLSPAAALDVFLIVLLLVAAHGAYGLARRFGADRTGAVLAGVAFAGSGFIACQLKHLSIVSTVVWLPAGLILLDRTLDWRPASFARRAMYIGLFGLVLAEQSLSGFPQSLYYCGLVYGSFVLFRAIANRRELGSTATWLALLGGIAVVTALGAAAGAVVLVPLSKLGAVSDRAEALGWEWATRLAYWPPNVWTFLWPYVHGDISDNTYVGPPFFWEDYGYVGLATVLLAIYGGVRDRRRSVVAFTIAMTLLGYFIVLGAATPVYRVIYLVIPGMKLFRFPTRFLIVVELGLALLGAIGLTRLRADLGRRPATTRVAGPIAMALCAVTVVDLIAHQPRQNPMVRARDWLAAPPSVEVIRRETSQPRTFTPRHRDLHRRMFLAAHGWTDVRPYFELRNLLEPNTGGGLWDTPSADCYAGISARWYIDVWSDHNRESSLVQYFSLIDFDAGRLRLHPALSRILPMYGVTHVLSPYPQDPQVLDFVARSDNAYIYRVNGAARVRFVQAARAVSDDREAAGRLMAADFDPDREILLHDVVDGSVHATLSEAGNPIAGGKAAITHEDQRELAIDVQAPADGFLLLADTYYPGWTARVDGQSTPLYRANISLRGIRVPRGRHDVRFTYDAPGTNTGLAITVVAVLALTMWTLAAGYAVRRSGSPGGASLAGSVSAATR